MIKFFRQIRQNLIMENKTSKYFKYAIGEIFLVVIGILIALQINNWNEEQANKKIERNYMKNLLEDLQNDTKIYSSYAKNNIVVYQYIDSLVIYLKSPERKEHTSKTSYWARMMTTKFSRAQPVERTFEQMKSSGQLKLVKNHKVADGISQYYNSLSELEQYNQAAILWLVDYLKAVGKVFDGEVLLKILKERKQQHTDTTTLITEDRKTINELLSSAQYIYGVVKISEIVCDKRKEGALDLIELIKKEYKFD
jgi:hypothetical protein